MYYWYTKDPIFVRQLDMESEWQSHLKFARMPQMASDGINSSWEVKNVYILETIAPILTSFGELVHWCVCYGTNTTKSFYLTDLCLKWAKDLKKNKISLTVKKKNS